MKTFNDLIQTQYRVVIPSYQRAYSWGEQQIEQFLNDLKQINSKTYYYGHFIIEENNERKTYEIIDGQQRITTFVLFLLAGKEFLNLDILKYEDFIKNRFETIIYDADSFNTLSNAIIDNNHYEINDNDKTSSFIRIEKAIEYFGNIFNKNKIKTIDNLIETLLNSNISTHITNEKSVAVQIFELQNSRGIKLDLIEKVKAKLMKELYLYSKKENVENQILQVQSNFTEIYKLEEKTKESSFRGEVSLQNILFYHLRVIDDGSKLNKNNEERKIQELLRNPSNGNDENDILNYLTEQFDNKDNKAEYIINLSSLFEKSVRFICETLIEKDIENQLIGDCIILDKNHSLELYLILLHLNIFDNMNFEKLELFLFTRDFHEKYYKQWYRDNFQWLYQRIISQNENINAILDNFISLGFRRELFNDDLQGVFKNYLKEKENNIKYSAFYFWKEKMTYLLYKYEISLDENSRAHLRKVFKNNKTLDHILPQNWQSIPGYISNEDFKNSIDSVINGIGNLLIVTQSENSILSDKAPQNKSYRNNQYGSYKEFEEKKKYWQDSNNWMNLINDRSNKIYDFLFEYFGSISKSV